MSHDGAGNENSEEQAGDGFFNSGNLEDHLKEQTSEMKGGEGMWKASGSMDLMEERLIEIAEYVWVDAARRTDRDDRRKVKPKEIDDAFDNLLSAQNLLMRAANEMRDLRWRFMDLAEESPAIDFDRDREKDE